MKPDDWLREYEKLCAIFGRKRDDLTAAEYLRTLTGAFKGCLSNWEITAVCERLKQKEDRFPSAARIIREIDVFREEERKKRPYAHDQATMREEEEFEKLLEDEARQDEEVRKFQQEDPGLYQVCLFKAHRENPEIFETIRKALAANPEMAAPLAKSLEYGEVFRVWDRIKRTGR